MQKVRKISRIESQNFNNITTKKFSKSNDLSFCDDQTKQKQSFQKMLEKTIKNLDV